MIDVTIQLPAVITGCNEYATLTEEERASLLGRLQSSRNLGLALAEGELRKDYPDFFQFVETVEQDASHIQEFHLPWGGAISRWLMHYSWTFDTTPKDMRACLTAEMVDLINASEPSTDAPLESSDRWIRELGRGLVVATNAIADATDYGSAMAHQIALDILLGKVLSACYKLRLNGLVPR